MRKRISTKNPSRNVVPIWKYYVESTNAVIISATDKGDKWNGAVRCKEPKVVLR